jgi:hypothetical protein
MSKEFRFAAYRKDYKTQKSLVINTEKTGLIFCNFTPRV